MTVNDEVTLAEGKTDIVLFRWHLGTGEHVIIAGTDKHWEVTWPDATLTLKASAPIAVSQVQLPDNTLRGHTGFEDSANGHACVVVQSRDPQPTLMLFTAIRPFSGSR